MTPVNSNKVWVIALCLACVIGYVGYNMYGFDESPSKLLVLNIPKQPNHQPYQHRQPEPEPEAPFLPEPELEVPFLPEPELEVPFLPEPEPEVLFLPDPKCPLPDKMFDNADCEQDFNLNASLVFPPPTFSGSPHDFYNLEAVHLMEDTDWGFTCNKLEILGGAMHRILLLPRSTTRSALALGPIFSNLAKNLDLKYLSQAFPILLDCNLCDQLVHCNSIYYQGLPMRTAGNRKQFPVFTKQRAGDMYWFYGPGALGFSTVLAKFLLPTEVTRRSIEHIMDLSKQVNLLGVHRRDIDGYCYQYVGEGTLEYECSFTPKLRQEIDAIKVEGTKALKSQGKFAALKALEPKHPMLMACNYSMDAMQQKIFQQKWPTVFDVPGKKFNVLFTTDNNDKKGDAKLLKSTAIRTSFKIEEKSPHDGACTNEKHPQRPHRLMLKEMYALALADYHMANPCSSCDVIVVHWRKVLGKAVGSSFPPQCFDGYYLSESLANWEAVMPFYIKNATHVPTRVPLTTHVPTPLPTLKPNAPPTLKPSAPPTLQPVLKTTATPTSEPTIIIPTDSKQCNELGETFESPDCEQLEKGGNDSMFPFSRDPVVISHEFTMVHALLDTDWGFTCNKLEILAGAMYQVFSEPRSNSSALALGPRISSLAKNLDLTHLSQDFPILLDCRICNSTVNCKSQVVHGKRLPGGQFPIYKQHLDNIMYWEFGPSALGMMMPLATHLIPSKAIRLSMEHHMRNQTAKSSLPILGVHRRDIDGYCYAYVGGGELEYECATNDKLNEEIRALESVNTLLLRQTENFAKLKALEPKHPMLMTCNYSMDAMQQKIFQQKWPTVFDAPEKKFNVLLTTDSNDVQGDNRLVQSSAIHKWFEIGDFGSDGTCTSEKHPQRPHRLMLKEMYALALADYHMANPCSSCDVIVVHWRKVLGKAVGSSFPPLCYDGYYTSQVEWRAKMPLFTGGH
ncbi:hypothetical protein BASA81_000055 [Batrachochytrium salamandrivorans]|nr:hypothetical protein BASA81_000055 [Batrachochytrium salamandrivorans]